jgi:Uma2 family endonuclease
VQKRLLLLFDRWESNHRLFALPELRNRTGETRCRIPDVAVYAGSEPREEVPTTPPLVAIEILSPDDRMQYLMEKLREYRAWGVAHIWVIDPAAKTLCEYGSDGLREVAALRLPEYGLAVGLGDLFPES